MQKSYVKHKKFLSSDVETRALSGAEIGPTSRGRPSQSSRCRWSVLISPGRGAKARQAPSPAPRTAVAWWKTVKRTRKI